MEQALGGMGGRAADHPVMRLAEAVNAHAGLVRRGERIDTTMLLEYGDTPFLVQIRRGRVDAVTRGPFVMPSCSAAPRDKSISRSPTIGPRSLTRTRIVRPVSSAVTST